MNIIYLTFLLLMTSILSSFITMSLPDIKSTFKRVLYRFKQRFTRKSREVVTDEKQSFITREEYDMLIQQINQVLGGMNERFEKIDETLQQREYNKKHSIKKYVVEYLNELKK